jgi:hypothetical protein
VYSLSRVGIIRSKSLSGGFVCESRPSQFGVLSTCLARNYMRESRWYTTFPGLALAVTVLGFN